MRMIVIFVALVLMCSGVFAISGVSPASYEVDFVPGYNGEFVFNFVIEGSEDLYVDGELAEFVFFDEKSISGVEEVVVVLDLPLVIDSPGVNYIRIGAGDVWGFIKVNVPYPERYVEVGLNAPNANVGEEVLFELELFGKGSESVVVSSRIEIYRDGDIIDIIDVLDVNVSSGGEISVNVSFDTRDYFVGSYLAVAFVDYDSVSVSVENPFRLGEFSVGLVDYTKSFMENKVGRFEILVESFWDDDMKDVYADVSVLGFASANFVTSSEDLPAWGRQRLVGFLDMSEIDEDSFEAEIVLHYGDESVSEVVELNVVKGFDYVFWIVGIVIVGVLVLLVLRSMVFVRRFKKHRIKR